MKIISSNCQSGRGEVGSYISLLVSNGELNSPLEFSHYDVIWVRWKIHGNERKKQKRTHYFYTYVCFTLKPPSFNHKYPSTHEDISWWHVNLARLILNFLDLIFVGRLEENHKRSTTQPSNPAFKPNLNKPTIFCLDSRGREGLTNLLLCESNQFPKSLQKTQHQIIDCQLTVETSWKNFPLKQFFSSE